VKLPFESHWRQCWAKRSLKNYGCNEAIAELQKANQLSPGGRAFIANLAYVKAASASLVEPASVRSLSSNCGVPSFPVSLFLLPRFFVRSCLMIYRKLSGQQVFRPFAYTNHLLNVAGGDRGNRTVAGFGGSERGTSAMAPVYTNLCPSALAPSVPILIAAHQHENRSHCTRPVVRKNAEIPSIFLRAEFPYSSRFA
jgi:hypothetical protein